MRLIRTAALFFCLICSAPSWGLTISENIGEDDITRQRNFTTPGGGPFYFFREDLYYEQNDLALNPGDPISIELNFPDALRLDGFYPGESFTIRMRLLEGREITGSNQSLEDGRMELRNLSGANPSTPFVGGWLSESTTEIETFNGVTPNDEAAFIDGVTWNLIAPDWVPEGSNVDFLFFITLQIRGSEVVDANRDLITFATSTLLPGDYNADGFVSQADLDLVLLNWGDSTLPGGFDESALADDGPFDGLISQNELDGVLLNWGDGTPPSIHAIPEPGAAALLGLLSLGGFTRRLPAIRHI